MQQLLPWILASLSLALLLGSGIAWALRGRAARQPPLPTQSTLAERPVFSAEERRVFRQLREALPHHIVLSKLPLARFSQPTDPAEVRYWHEVLGSQHVSFAICSANGRVLAAIDLESDRGTSRRSLQIKQSVLAACKVRYLRYTPGRLPSVPELQLLVPQVGPSARGPHLAAAPAVSEARDQLASTLASKRRERTTLWADSGYMQDSFFGTDRSMEAGVVSGFGALQSQGGVLVREMNLRPDDIAGALEPEPAPRTLRH
jgi:hypothetical protein